MTGADHALVTGSSSGIGRACVLKLLERGFAVTGWDLHEPPDWPSIDDGTFHFQRVDVTDQGAIRAAAAEARDRHGPWRKAVNCAGILGPVGLLHEVDPAEVRETLETNLTSVYYCMAAELAQMFEAGGGAIVNIASAAGLVGFPGAGAYTASKFGIVGLTKNAAIDYAQSGIRVNAVAPGGVDTPLIRATTCATPEGEAMITGMHPMQRLAQPAEIAAAVGYLLSDAASFVTGEVLSVDGGWCAQ